VVEVKNRLQPHGAIAFAVESERIGNAGCRCERRGDDRDQDAGRASSPTLGKKWHGALLRLRLATGAV
jgi:hypothetical protein